MTEEWRDVVRFEGLYRVSLFGEIESLMTGRLRKTRLRNGSLMVLLNNPRTDTSVTCQVARLVLMAWHPVSSPRDYWADYRDEDPTNCRLDNLFWQLRRGEVTPRARLTETDVHEIRRLWMDNQTYKQIARQINETRDDKITLGAVGRVIRGETWGHVK